MAKIFSFALVSLAILLSSCGDNASTQSSSSGRAIIAYGVRYMIFSGGYRNTVVRFNTITGVVSNLIDSALIFSPPVDGKMAVLKDINTGTKYTRKVSLYSSAGKLIKNLFSSDDSTTVRSCVLSSDGKLVAFDQMPYTSGESQLCITNESGSVLETGILLNNLAYNFTSDSKGIICLDKDNKIIYYDIQRKSSEILADYTSTYSYFNNVYFMPNLSDKSCLLVSVDNNSNLQPSLLEQWSKSGDQIVSAGYFSTTAFCVNKNGTQAFFGARDSSLTMNSIVRYDHISGAGKLLDTISNGYISIMAYSPGNNSIYFVQTNSDDPVNPNLLWRFDLNTMKRTKLVNMFSMSAIFFERY